MVTCPETGPHELAIVIIEDKKENHPLVQGKQYITVEYDIVCVSSYFLCFKTCSEKDTDLSCSIFLPSGTLRYKEHTLSLVCWRVLQLKPTLKTGASKLIEKPKREHVLKINLFTYANGTRGRKQSVSGYELGLSPHLNTKY